MVYNMSCYIIKNKNNIISYYYRENNIYKREFKNNNWSNENIVAENARKNFAVCYGNENILLYQLVSGDIYMTDEKLKHKLILKSTQINAPDIVIHSILTNNLRLVYNIVDDENCLVTQIQGEDKLWNKPQKIDSFISDTMRIVELGSNLHMLIYAKKMPEYQIGYREINNQKIGNFKKIYSSGYNITDFSYVITKDILHFVFVQSTGFMQRIIYVKNSINSIPKKKLLFEGFNIKNCLVFIKHNKLYIFWTSNRSTNYITSFDYGETFEKPKFKRGLNNISKALFVDKTIPDEDNYICNEVYVEDNKPYKALFLDDSTL